MRRGTFHTLLGSLDFILQVVVGGLMDFKRRTVKITYFGGSVRVAEGGESEERRQANKQLQYLR